MARLAIDPATWAALDALLDEALDQPPEAREAWLAGLGGERAALATRLRALLARAGDPGLPGTLPRLGTLTATALPADPAPDGGPGPGALVGPYRLVRPIGEGGMGTVWIAVRDDGLVPRPVALKLPNQARHAAGLAERMARERAILASLEHPHIARLYDAGVAADGQPWLALELVDGRPIDAHVRAAGLDARARVRLWLQVAEAVAHAHGRLVVHRDLKPSNVLVTPDGQARLLDFGIAKLLGDGPETGPALTEAGSRVLTPAYAAPEQLRGEPVGVAVDVYALGVLLFELLAEARPYRPADASRHALEEAILAGEPLRASAAAADPAARRALRGDLDAVLARALRKQPAERYPSAEAFAEDLRRWLAGRPVTAHPDRPGYRLRRFVGRHRLGVAAAAAVATSLAVGLGMVVAEKRRTDEVREFFASMKPTLDLAAAERAFTRARGLDARGDLHPRAIETRFTWGRALVEAGRLDEGIGQLARAEGEAASRFGDTSMIAGAVLASLVAAQVEVGDLAAALPASERVVRIYGLRTEPGSYPLAAALQRRAEVLLAARRPAEALPLLERAVATQADLLGDWHERTVAGRLDRAAAWLLMSQPGPAEGEARLVLDHLPPGDLATAPARHLVGAARRASGDAGEGRRWQEAALEALRPGEAWDGLRGRILAELGRDLLEAGEARAAVWRLEEGVELLRARLRHPTADLADAEAALERARSAARPVSARSTGR